jgi:hypothetical protein
VLGALVLACGGQRPQTLTPVRIDPSTVAALGGARPAMTTADDPFAPLVTGNGAGPNQYRSASGQPGPAYWQQRADYTLAVALDTARHVVGGTVTIRYTNNSPDTLRFVWLQLEQNTYAPDSRGSHVFRPESRGRAKEFAGGYTLADVTVDGKPAVHVVNDARMRIDLDRPVAPNGGRATFAMRFSFPVPVKGSDRMGRDGTLYAIAQWYPKMAVYDDVVGWYAIPYFGQGEFYTEYGDFDVAVTVPSGYVVAGTGTLANASEVLTVEQRARLERAARADTGRVTVVGEGERVPATGATRTWRYRAENVRDVAWAAAPDFRWDAGAWNGVMLHAFYQPQKAKGAWDRAIDHTRWSIRYYSELLLPYPYPQATSVATTIAGMEYPMIVFNPYGSAGNPESIWGVNDHEHAHQWFPMIVGTNERRFEWMDEGIGSYVNAFSREARDTTARTWDGFLSNWRSVVTNGVQTPLMTRTDHYASAARGAIGYRKPAVALLALRNHVIGAAMMDRALREYARRWAFRHPYPEDFFRTVEDVSGEDLDWFWRGFFHSTDVLDVGIEDVTVGDTLGRREATVTLTRTSIPFPVAIRFRLEDGATHDVRLPVDVWAHCLQEQRVERAGCTRIRTTITVPGTVTGARLWPVPTVPDWNEANDSWGNAPAADPAGRVTAGATLVPVPSRGGPR